MTKEDLEFLQGETKTIVSLSIPSPLKSQSEFSFIVVAADMDQVQKTHIYEGRIFVRKLQEIDQDEVHQSAQDLFGANAWEIANSQLPFKVYGGEVQILGDNKTSHYDLKENADLVAEKVKAYPNNQKRLVIQTLDQGWQIGTLTQIMELIQKSIKNE